MTTAAKSAVLVFVTILVAGFMVHLFLPGGLPRVLDKLTASAPEPKKAAPAAPVTAAPAAPSGDAEVRDAEHAYDSGDFSRAIDLFVAARADTTAVLHDRAVRGLYKSALAWALTRDARLPSPIPDDPEGEVAIRQAAADKTPSERAWYDVLMYAAGVGATRKLPSLAHEAIQCATSGGPVMTKLNDVLAAGGPRTSVLREAMDSERLLDPADPYGDPASPHTAAKRAPASASLPPSGNFKPETKLKLAQAVDFERQGTAEYEKTGPENPDRKAHRKKAYDLLKKARDIYEAAQEEDPLSKELDRHLHAVMEMLSPLHKEMALGD
jgi:hypothetical protein